MTRPQTAQSGSVFTILLAGIAIAGALSVVLYSTMSGPMASMVRVTNKTMAKSQMQSVSSIVIMAAVNAANNGACDIAGGNTYVVPPAWRTGTVGAEPTNGGLIPTTIGAPTTDPWGTDYGYCAWEVGAPQTKCNGANMLTGTATPASSNAGSSIVIAVISAGPDRHFSTTCRNYDSTGGVGTETNANIVPGGDDVVQSFTYQQAAVATSSLWTLKSSDATKAVISKNLEIGTSLGTVPGTVPANGLINADEIVTAGGIFSGGAVGLGSMTTAGLAGLCIAGSVGNMYYESDGTPPGIVVCTCTGASCPATGTYAWTAAGSGSGGGTLDTILAAAADGTLQNSAAHPIIWNWNSLAGGTGLTLGSTSTAAASNTQTLLNVALSGANGTSAQTTYGEQISNTHTGTASTNVALYATASGGTNNYAAIFNAGNVGIGTAVPVSSLQVATGGLFSVTGTYGSGATLPAGLTGAGTRMFFYPNKAAFRAGYVNSTQWDDTNIGAYSVAMGADTTASGSTATAMGSVTTASGLIATAMGSWTTASGSVATAMGNSTIASGSTATAMGYLTTAQADDDTAIGAYNVGGGTTTSWVATDPIFEIGIGTSGANANAVTVLKNGNVGIGTTTAATLLSVAGPLSLQEPPAAKTATTYTVTTTDSSLIFAPTATTTVTLLAAASYPGQILYMSNTAAFAINSASSNIVPQAGGSAAAAILPATAGTWVELQSNGTNWVIMASGGGGARLDQIKAATASNTIDNLLNTQIWNWSTLATGTTAMAVFDTNTSSSNTIALQVANYGTGTSSGVWSANMGTNNAGYAGYFQNEPATNSGVNWGVLSASTTTATLDTVLGGASAVAGLMLGTSNAGAAVFGNNAGTTNTGYGGYFTNSTTGTAGNSGGALGVNGFIDVKAMPAPAVPASSPDIARLYYDSTSHTLQVSQQGAAYAALGGSYDLSMFYPGTVGGAAIVRVVSARTATYPVGLTGSYCVAKAGATSSTAVTLKQIHAGTSTNVGTVIFGSGGGTNVTNCTFITNPSGISLAPGDALEFAFPVTPDATLSDVAITLKGTHS